MTFDASDQVPGMPEIGEEDRQDLMGDMTDIERQILPGQIREPVTSRGEMEKLARFFSDLPGPKEAKTYFFGFINQIQQYGFYDTKNDIPLLLEMYDQAEAAYINSVPAWEYRREHSVMLSNIRTLFYSLIRGAVGTDKDIMNSRLALNMLRVHRAFSEFPQQKKGFMKRF